MLPARALGRSLVLAQSAPLEGSHAPVPGLFGVGTAALSRYSRVSVPGGGGVHGQALAFARAAAPGEAVPMCAGGTLRPTSLLPPTNHPHPPSPHPID